MEYHLFRLTFFTDNSKYEGLIKKKTQLNVLSEREARCRCLKQVYKEIED